MDEGTKRLVMVFSGQGYPVGRLRPRAVRRGPRSSRRAIDAIEEHWRLHSDASLRDACFSAPQDELNEVRLAQPAIFMIQCALVELLKTWGVYADCVIGHSSGEVAAAYACGALSLAEATRLVFHRATLQQRTAGSGRMLAIGLDRAGVGELLEGLRVPFQGDGEPADRVEIACVNSPANTVVCGKRDALEPVHRRAGPAPPAACTAAGQYRLPFRRDGRHRERRTGGLRLPGRLRPRRGRAVHFVGDRRNSGAAG